MTFSGSPLEYAVTFGRVSVARHLLANGADPHAKSLDGSLPMLAIAVQAGNLTLSRLMVEHGAATETNTLSQALCMAAGKGFTELARFLIAQGADIHASPTGIKKAAPPLLVAVRENQAAMAELLLDLGADIHARDASGDQPLHHAVYQYGSLGTGILELLIKRGADVNAAGQLTPVGQSANAREQRALHLAARLLQTEPAQLLLRHGADVNAQDSLGATPLLVATSRGNAPLATLLLKQNADPSLAGKTPEWSHPAAPPLAVAVMNQKRAGDSFVRLLLEHGASPNIAFKTEVTKSLLILAMFQKDVKLTELLLAHGANPDFLPDEYPLQFAISRHHTQLIQPMIDAGANVNRLQPKNFPLLAAVREWDTNAVAILLKNGADPNLATPADGITALAALSKTDMRNPLGVDREAAKNAIRQRLLAAGANYVSGDPNGITLIRKSNDERWTLLLRDHQPFSEFTLLEAIAIAYGQERIVPGLHFPDFTQVRLHRPEGSGYLSTRHNLETILADARSGDPKLRWGDVIEVPEAPHLINAIWSLPHDFRELLVRRLSRTVTVRLGDRDESLTLTPFPELRPESPRTLSPNADNNDVAGNWLWHLKEHLSSQISTSHDLSQVSVVRQNSPAAEPFRILYDLDDRRSSLRRSFTSALPQPMNRELGLWLRAGDLIIFPAKPAPSSRVQFDPVTPAPAP